MHVKRSLVPKKSGPCMKLPYTYIDFYVGSKFLRVHISQGSNFLGTKFLGGPNFSGTKKVRGPNEIGDKFSYRRNLHVFSIMWNMYVLVQASIDLTSNMLTARITVANLVFITHFPSLFIF